MMEMLSIQPSSSSSFYPPVLQKDGQATFTTLAPLPGPFRASHNAKDHVQFCQLRPEGQHGGISTSGQRSTVSRAHLGATRRHIGCHGVAGLSWHERCFNSSAIRPSASVWRNKREMLEVHDELEGASWDPKEQRGGSQESQEPSEPAVAILEETDFASSSWMDENYIWLSLRAYSLTKKEAQQALQHHFKRAPPHQRTITGRTKNGGACSVEDAEVVLDHSYTTTAGGAWIDENYLSLNVRAYSIMRSEVQLALEKHFKTHNDQPEGHTCCAKDRASRFVCGLDAAVASSVKPACLASEGIFLGTS